MSAEIVEARGIQYPIKKVDVYLEDNNGNIVVNIKNVIAPVFWEYNSVQITASKYFKLGEKSIFDLVERVVSTIEAKSPHLKEKFPDIFDELYHLLITQYGAFNSPVWFNVGASESPQVSACYILHLDDDMDDILDKFKVTGNIFKDGSGVGMSFSKLRESNARLSRGGFASGPLSFMKALDSAAGVIKSGGRLRRSANLYNLVIHHPDILEFIDAKAKEEIKVKTLFASGRYERGMDSEAYRSVSYQNVNLSVAVTDEFMKAYESNSPFSLRSVLDDSVVATMQAKDIFKRIAEKAWECGDPGLQYIDTINKWHTVPHAGPINASNPCSEYMFLDDSACNLASLNLEKFYDVETSEFDYALFEKYARIFIIVMDALVDIGHYPTKDIQKNVKKYRALGLGFAGLGSTIMSMGLPYDSDEAREFATKVTRIMAHTAYRTSQELAELFNHNMTKKDQETLKHVVQDMHGFVDLEGPFRNAQVTVLAPTGTIGFMMGVDSTGIEPVVAPQTYKQLSGGGSMVLSPSCAKDAMTKLGYNAKEGEAYVKDQGTYRGFVREEHLPIFETAIDPGGNVISPEGHLKMMAAVQPYLSGSISKTVNVPNNYTVEDIEKVYYLGWKMGLKAVALYRDGSKAEAPLSASKSDEDLEKSLPVEELNIDLVYDILDDIKHSLTNEERRNISKKLRKRLPDVRNSITHKFTIGDHEGYLTLSFYEDGTIGEMFIQMAKEGSTLSGVMDAFATSISIALQHGLPLELFETKYIGTRFEPSGWTDDPNVRNAKSILDYIFQWIRNYNDVRKKYHSHNDALVEVKKDYQTSDRVTAESDLNRFDNYEMSDKICPLCNSRMVKSGSCYTCTVCGESGGCG